LTETVFIALGSNIGEREKNLERAIGLLAEKCEIVKKSRVHETEPVGFKEQPLFLNQVVEAKTGLSPEKLLGFLKGIEKKMGRKKTFRNGPRIIDLDIVFFGKRTVSEKNLSVPHPRMHERAFVLEPLAEIAPFFVHPEKKKTVAGLLRELQKK
jgi:2-amino-4-hydroxy-6-hydroxymethyldihydropteridine diphosphokinase